MKICPFCESELSDTAKKCKFCWEWIMNGGKWEWWNNKYENSKSVITATRWMRFMSRFIDMLLIFSIIWWFINFYYIFSKKTTLWNLWSWIKLTSIKWEKIKNSRIFLRIFTICPNITLVLLYLWIIINVFLRKIFVENWIFFASPVSNVVVWMMWIVFILNFIELFFSEPTFFWKLIWIKRIQYAKPKKWIRFISFMFFILLSCISNPSYLSNVINKWKMVEDFSCRNVINEKYIIIDEYARCTWEISWEWFMWWQWNELMTRWANDCVWNLIENYTDTNNVDSYDELNCDWTWLEVLYVLDNFFENFYKCFEEKASKKWDNESEAKKIIQGTFNCNSEAVKDYMKIIPYVDYLFADDYTKKAVLANITDFNCGAIFNKKYDIIENFFMCVNDNENEFIDCFVLLVDKYEETQTWLEICSDDESYEEITNIDALYSNLWNCLTEKVKDEVSFIDGYKCFQDFNDKFDLLKINKFRKL